MLVSVIAKSVSPSEKFSPVSTSLKANTARHTGADYYKDNVDLSKDKLRIGRHPGACDTGLFMNVATLKVLTHEKLTMMKMKVIPLVVTFTNLGPAKIAVLATVISH